MGHPHFASPLCAWYLEELRQGGYSAHWSGLLDTKGRPVLRLGLILCLEQVLLASSALRAVCMLVCAHVCLCVLRCACVCTYGLVHAHMCSCVHMCACVCSCVHVGECFFFLPQGTSHQCRVFLLPPPHLPAPFSPPLPLDTRLSFPLICVTEELLCAGLLWVLGAIPGSAEH